MLSVVWCSLQASLLDIEERAVLLAELEQAEDGGGEVEMGLCRRCGKTCYSVCCDIGSISIVVMVAVTIVGVLLLVSAVAIEEVPFWVEELARYIISAGVFGLATGGTNAIAVFMLLYKLPLVCGSG